MQFLISRDALIDYAQIKLGEKIGRGTFAKVWEGTWRGSRVAVKKLCNPNVTEKSFVREVSNLQRGRHPRVVRFLGASLEPPCIITEFMAGGSLFDALHKKGIRFELKVLLQMAKEMAEGMAHLHSLNILHRDLTSKNILLDGDGDEFHHVKISGLFFQTTKSKRVRFWSFQRRRSRDVPFWYLQSKMESSRNYKGK